MRKHPASPHIDEYRSIYDAAHKIYTQEGGLPGLYTGVIQDTSKTIVDSFLFFLTYNFLRQSRLRSRISSSQHLPVLDELSVGFFAGAFSKLLTTPIANIVTRKQTSSMLSAHSASRETAQPTTVNSITREIYAEKGLQGFWSGYSASLVLTLNPSLTFFLYETFKGMLLPRSQRTNPPPSATFLLAAISKAIASTITYPFSLAKARAQTSSETVSNTDQEIKESIEKASDGNTSGMRPARKAARKTVFSTIIQIAQTEGIGALYEGLGGEVLKGFFSHGITMIIKEAVHRLIIQLYYVILKVLKMSPERQGAIDKAKNQIEYMVRGATEQAQQTMNSVQDGTTAALTRGKYMLVNGSTATSNAYDTTSAGAKSMGVSAKDNAIQMMNQAIGQASQSKASLIEVANSTMSRGQELPNKVSEYGTIVYDTSLTAAESAGEAAQSLANVAVDQTPDAATKVYSKARYVGERVSGETGSMVENAAEYVGRRTEEAGRAIRTSGGTGECKE